MKEINMVAIIVVTLMILIGVLLLKNKPEILLGICIKGGAGILAIKTINFLLTEFGMEISVGINEITLLVCFALGVPGVIVLYSVNLITKM